MAESLEAKLMDEYKQFMAEAKPDFLDLDKDGNKKEPMKKAAKEKKTTEGADQDKIPAFIRKQKEKSQKSADDATDKRNQSSGAKVWSHKR
jgi:hypothetical protein